MTTQQPSLFSWDDVDLLDDLQRLMRVLEFLPDDGIIEGLETRRGHGRNDYPVAALWLPGLFSSIRRWRRWCAR